MPEATVTVIVEVPEPVIDDGLKPMVTPEGAPEAESVTAESKPPVTVLVMVELPELPAAMEREEGEADSVKPGWVEEEPARALMRLVPLGLPHPLVRS